MNHTHIGGIALLVSVIAVAAIVLGSGPQGSGSPAGDESGPPLVVGDAMTVIVADVASLSDLAAAGIPAPEELDIPRGITRYDIVTFDHAAVNGRVREGALSLRIRGEDYRAGLERMTFDQIDDGIDSYEGTIPGAGGSDVLLTTSENTLTGSVTLGGETFWIRPVEPRMRAEGSASPLHMIYSSRDLEQQVPVLVDRGPGL
ncbi:hypothetical protein [Methanoculleus sp.]|uniref:hypothetical protein n=1 Tax=Methanoculleus sp. TaxID=90427 RepID=UPI0025D84651|nr:hypothetical protein [Methanoculleus sp.]